MWKCVRCIFLAVLLVAAVYFVEEVYFYIYVGGEEYGNGHVIKDASGYFHFFSDAYLGDGGYTIDFGSIDLSTKNTFTYRFTVQRPWLERMVPIRVLRMMDDDIWLMDEDMWLTFGFYGRGVEHVGDALESGNVGVRMTLTKDGDSLLFNRIISHWIVGSRHSPYFRGDGFILLPPDGEDKQYSKQYAIGYATSACYGKEDDAKSYTLTLEVLEPNAKLPSLSLIMLSQGFSTAAWSTAWRNPCIDYKAR